MGISTGRKKMIEELVNAALDYGMHDKEEDRELLFRLQARIERSVASLERELAAHRSVVKRRGQK